MPPWSKGILWTLLTLLGLFLAFVLLLIGIANTQTGRAWLERGVSAFSGESVRITGLAGRFPEAIRLTRIELHDAAGAWLVVENLRMDWSPAGLFRGVVVIDRLEAERIFLERRPVADSAEPSEAPSLALPFRIRIRAFGVERLDLAAPVAGAPAALAIEGSLNLASGERMEFDLAGERLDTEGRYRMEGRVTPDGLQATLTAQESPHGLLSSLAGLPDLGALALAGSVEGPRSALKTRIDLTAGAMAALAEGTLDLERKKINLSVRALAPAMQPAPDLAWSHITVDAEIQGAFDQPLASGVLRVEELNVGGVAVGRITAELEAGSGRVETRSSVEGLRLPDSPRDLLRGEALTIEAEIRLTQPEYPLLLRLRHPFLVGAGEINKEARGFVGRMQLSSANLAPIAEVFDLEVEGTADLTLGFTIAAGITHLDLGGKLGIVAGMEPLPALIGKAADLRVVAALHGEELTLSKLQLDGQALEFKAAGLSRADFLKLDFALTLPDLSALTPDLRGRISSQGSIQGPTDGLELTADLTGDLASAGFVLPKFTANLRLQGFPRALQGLVTARSVLDGAPADLELALRQESGGPVHVAIRRAEWMSARLGGDLVWERGEELPTGKVDLRMSRLDDLRRLTGRPLSGSLMATLESSRWKGRDRLRLRLDARNAGVSHVATIARAVLSATVIAPTTRPGVDGSLTLDGLAAGGKTTHARLEVSGPFSALRMTLTANTLDVVGSDLALTGVAVFQPEAKRVGVSAFEAGWKGERVRLLSPVQVSLGDGVVLGRAQLGLRRGRIEMAGRIHPTLDFQVKVHDFPADLFTRVTPEFTVEGVLRADAKFTGTIDHPLGTVDLGADGLRVGTGRGRALPAMQAQMEATFTKDSALIHARLAAERGISARIAGSVPRDSTGPMNLDLAGEIDLSILDPLLTPEGRRVHGKLGIAAGIEGSPSAPRLGGTARLAQGDLQDYARGLHIGDVRAVLRAEGEVLHLETLEGRAGPGTIRARGQMAILQPGLPFEVRISARKARPLASDRLTADLDGEILLRGRASASFVASGSIRIERAEIRIPEHLPARVAVLNVRRPGAPPPPPPAPGPEVVWDLEIVAPRAVFVRGRGLDAELGGKVHLQGTSKEPEPEGHFEMIRGQLSLAGQTIMFKRGRVGFDGGSLVDPTLDFSASTTQRNITATLEVRGTARKPVIALSSVPELPQDEVLAHLLFGTATAFLGPVELGQITLALASLAGVPGVSDPLEKLRAGLSLDRLTIGRAQGGATLEAGRYVAPGVYVGARQGVSGTPQSTVRIDITRGLKLESVIGTGSASGSHSGTNSVGVIYEFEY
ncbi:MAG TPA: translocation/assembly module TamB domain-containing protein [Methylococcus sp.]|nr:translocation/assembly module TamB domain-containing protein [Methylococcus sp.]